MDTLRFYIFLLILGCNALLNVGNDIVISGIVEPRFLRYKKGKYSGFIPDLVAELSEIADFNYTFRLVNEGRNEEKENRRLLRKHALDELIGYDTDMVATTLSISKSRKKLVDFSIPFDRHGITALFKRPPAAIANPIESFEDLLYQTEYVFGTIIRSSIDRFFGHTMESPYWEMGGFMDMYDEYMVDNVKEGLEHIRSNIVFSPLETTRKSLKHRNHNDLKYMFLVDSTIADHLIHKYPCDLVRFGQIRGKGYGFAYRKGDALLRYKIDDALKILIQNGTVTRLKEKWWKDDQRCDWESRYYYY